jgi:predicted DNA-binding transcriptional regulator YafY
MECSPQGGETAVLLGLETQMLKTSEEKATASNAVDLRRAIRIIYTNYRGETAQRTIVPQRVWFGATEWHPEEQWLLDAVDVEKNAQRSFALRDIKSYVA